MNKMILAAAMIVATIASVAPASAMQIVSRTQSFPPRLGAAAPGNGSDEECRSFRVDGGPGVQVRYQLVSFSRPVVNAVAVLTGFDVKFSDGDDHHLGRLNVSVGILGATGGQSVNVCSMGCVTGQETGTTSTKAIYTSRSWGSD
jgi:hypothetical protein